MTVEPTQPPSEQAAPEPPAGVRAWQPFTPRGVAAFAAAPLGRLLGVQLAVALLAAGALVWFLLAAWCPVIGQAVSRLPEEGQIRDGRLVPGRAWPEPLAESRHLALVLDVTGQSRAGLAADLRVRFGHHQVEFCSLLGCLGLNYPRGWIVQFNRADLQPWWAAWQPFLLALAAVAVLGLLLLLWSLLATLYLPAAWLLARQAGHPLTFAAAWKLAAAALLPGAVLLSAGLVLYGLGLLELLRLALLGVLHVLAGWFYLVTASLSAPPLPAKPSQPANPFAENTSP